MIQDNFGWSHRFNKPLPFENSTEPHHNINFSLIYDAAIVMCNLRVSFMLVHELVLSCLVSAVIMSRLSYRLRYLISSIVI